jgi:hypothetical protein
VDNQRDDRVADFVIIGQFRFVLAAFTLAMAICRRGNKAHRSILNPQGCKNVIMAQVSLVSGWDAMLRIFQGSRKPLLSRVRTDLVGSTWLFLRKLL